MQNCQYHSALHFRVHKSRLIAISTNMASATGCIPSSLMLRCTCTAPAVIPQSYCPHTCRSIVLQIRSMLPLLLFHTWLRLICLPRCACCHAPLQQPMQPPCRHAVVVSPCARVFFPMSLGLNMLCIVPAFVFHCLQHCICHWKIRHSVLCCAAGAALCHSAQAVMYCICSVICHSLRL